ncbi:MAG: hypothetical protein H8D67_19650 [Deltaproteobacteria bacterium]|nr:hypothetical protein [Deltaproteobacteria bacterium]
MKTIAKILVVIIICILPCTWLYTSGNLPYVAQPARCLVMAVNSKFPEAALITSNLAHRAWGKVRDMGLSVPLTYTERIKKIKKIRLEVAAICNRIISDKHRGVR